MSGTRVNVRVGIVDTASRGFTNIVGQSARAASKVKRNFSRLNARVGITDNATRALRKIERQAGKTARKIKTDFNNVRVKVRTAVDNGAADGLAELQGQAQGMGMAIGAAGAASVASLVETKKASLRLRAALGKNTEEAKGLQKAVDNIYMKGVRTDIMEITDAVILAKQAFTDLSDTDVEKLAKGNLNIEFATDIDQKALITGMQSLVKTYKIGAFKAQDLILKASERGVNLTEDMMDTIKEYPGTVDKIFDRPEELLSYMETAIKAGVFNTDTALDAVKEFYLKVNKADADAKKNVHYLGYDWDTYHKSISQGGEAAEKMLYDTMNRIASIKDKGKRDEVAQGIFGTKMEDDPRLIGALQKADQYTAAYEKAGGAVAKLNAEVENDSGTKLAAQWNTFRKEIEPLAVKLLDIGMVILPVLTDALGVVTGIFTGMPSGIQAVVVGLLGIVALATAFAPLIASITAISGVITAIATAAGLSVAAVLGIGVAIAAIVAAVIALGVLIYKNWDGIVKWAKKAWYSLGTVFINLKDYIVNGFTGAWDSVKRFTSDLVTNVRDTFSRGLSNIADFFIKPLEKVKSYLNKFKSGKTGNKVLDFVGKRMGKFLPKFHSGGIVGGASTRESLAVLQGGEQVLTKSQQRNNNSGGFSGYADVNLQLDGRTLAKQIAPLVAREIGFQKGGR